MSGTGSRQHAQTGTLSALGVDDVVPQQIVNNANLRKFDAGHSIREDGKLIKPPDFVPPEPELRDYFASISQASPKEVT